jgi:gamma-glutamylaminecyclotransferase
MTSIFVYGTLKRGGSNHRFLGGQRFVGTARTEPAFRLYQLDGYPGMVGAPGGLSIEGEIWEVDDAALARLDELEGTAVGLYRRVPVTLLPPHHLLEVETYLCLQSMAGRRELGTQFDVPPSATPPAGDRPSPAAG